ncbi:TPA: ImmA/IrrE family metallo-endopeptidase [Streptococcus suis]
MEASRKKYIRKKVDAVREKCIKSRYGIVDLFKDCERLGYKVIRYPLGSASDLGFAVKRNQDTIIFTNSSVRLSRELFTLAHEMGHIELHFETNTSFIDNSQTVGYQSFDAQEQEANYFAACLLMPEDEIRRFLDLELDSSKENLTAKDIARMMSEFNVSFDMALNRLENLQLITPAQKLLLDSEKVEKKVGNLLKSVGGNSKLNIESEVTEIPHEYIDYVIFNYNNNAIPRETLDKTLQYYNLSIDDISDELKNYSEADCNLDDLDELIGGLDC